MTMTEVECLQSMADAIDTWLEQAPLDRREWPPEYRRMLMASWYIHDVLYAVIADDKIEGNA